MNSRYFPDLNKSIVSKLNVENVLNPPIIPAAKKSFALSDILTDCCSSPTINPIKNPAITLDSKVPNGNDSEKPLDHFVIAYRKQDPTNPPIPTANNLAIILPFNLNLLLVEVIGLISGSAFYAQGALHSLQNLVVP
jgi:hypothetical protein